MATHPPNRRAFHPAVSILSWLVFAIAVELSAPNVLFCLALAAGILLAKREAGRHFLSLLWKARWLWLAMVLLYAYTLPGVYVWPGAYSPTYEGLQAGGLRVARLLLLLASLARLLIEFNHHQLAGGLYLLAVPFEWIKLDRRALAVRLALTLEQIDKMPPKNNWLNELTAACNPARGPEEIRLVLPAVSAYDAGLLLAACVLLGISLA